jgi:hypothetical protein
MLLLLSFAWSTSAAASDKESTNYVFGCLIIAEAANFASLLGKHAPTQSSRNEHRK